MPDFVSSPTLAASTPASAAQRLAESRQALVRHMNGEPPTQDPHPRRPDDESGHAAGGSQQSDTMFATLTHALSVWWRHHPFNAGLDLARPLVQDYARQHPVKLLGFAAAAGAAVVIIKPWRLVSIGGLLLATVKSSGLTSVVMSLVSRRPSHPTTSTDQPLHDPL